MSLIYLRPQRALFDIPVVKGPDMWIIIPVSCCRGNYGRFMLQLLTFPRLEGEKGLESPADSGPTGPSSPSGPRCEATPTAGPTSSQALEVATPKRAPLPVTASFSVLHNPPPPGWTGSSHEVGHGGFWTTQRGLKPPSFMSKELPDYTERRVLPSPIRTEPIRTTDPPPPTSSPHPQ